MQKFIICGTQGWRTVQKLVNRIIYVKNINDTQMTVRACWALIISFFPLLLYHFKRKKSTILYSIHRKSQIFINYFLFSLGVKSCDFLTSFQRKILRFPQLHFSRVYDL
jgi:hypothetical protein